VHSRSRPARLARTSARIFLAGMLVLALLTGIAPLNVLSSAPDCSMPCCASVASGGACATGACDAKLSGHSNKAKPPVNSGDAHSSHCSSMRTGGASAADGASSDHVDTVEARPPAQHGHQTPADAQSQSAGVLSGALAKPCPPDCCASASIFAQGRRSRDTAALAHNSRPRPQTIASRLHRSFILPSIADARLRGSSPRAPPTIFS
jgi:hypothetical protein